MTWGLWIGHLPNNCTICIHISIFWIFVILYSVCEPCLFALLIYFTFFMINFAFIGKYMQMMNILKPIAFDVIHCVSQLFDYYLYAVYTFFGRNDMVCILKHCCSPSCSVLILNNMKYLLYTIGSLLCCSLEKKAYRYTHCFSL